MKECFVCDKDKKDVEEIKIVYDKCSEDSPFNMGVDVKLAVCHDCLNETMGSCFVADID